MPGVKKGKGILGMIPEKQVSTGGYPWRGSRRGRIRGDAEASFHRLEGIEYMVAELRYGIVNIRWTKESKPFGLTCNLTVEEALSVAQAVVSYHDS